MAQDTSHKEDDVGSVFWGLPIYALTTNGMLSLVGGFITEQKKASGRLFSRGIRTHDLRILSERN